MSENSIKKSSYNPYVFFGSLIVLLVMVLYVSIFKVQAQEQMDVAKAWINTNFGWFYVLTVAIILITSVFLFFSRYGDIKLGPDHSKPNYSTMSWLSMLFAAGMGIGLMFWGVSEPIVHFLSPPDAKPETIEAARESMKLVFFHWGLSAWAIYAVVAVILAYFAFRHGLPLTLRSALYPLIGNRIYGVCGHLVDIFAVLGTIIGVSTTLGMGVQQINSGLNHLYDLPMGVGIQALLIIVTMMLVSCSVFSGLDKGVKRLSELNMVFAILLLLFVLVCGPTLFILQTFMQNMGGYLSGIVSRTFNLYAYESTDWVGNWTIFYWAWWLAWSPFVGSFIARISRGRTIREFIAGAMLVPAAFTLIWMTVFGDTALHFVLYDNYQALADSVSNNYSMGLFTFLEHFPFSSFACFFAVLMIFLFFVTSADSASMVIDMFASNGKTDTPVWQSLFWVIVITVVTIALMYSNGLQALQTASILSALPFAFALLFAMWGLVKALFLDATKKELRKQSLNISRPAPRSSGGWQRRLRNLTMFTRRSHVIRFIDEVVKVALEEVSEELNKQGCTATVLCDDEKNRVRLELEHEGKVYFAYEVRPRHYLLPDIISRTSTDEEDSQENRSYFRADVHLLEGGQDYDIMGWSKEDVIGDILDQYETYLHFIHITN
ncbi:BCCT family transporter [Entomomonas moraniae]|uniref:BCCT family transporter n=1 Tax=Entomomonas moraniae TaxID=2213226 RepID=A0A3Q9JMY5_9GAMM|nr:choline BCCT transporter BetT [Entomomonas moraniae]AZS52083.1 BCCT family transporter [Entomomonas moraniae]